MADQINLFNDRLKQQLEILQVEYQGWNNKKVDYDALETLLQILPETTTKAAMIPVGKLAFMPGKIIHTNEILTFLGDEYYAERSAKQAIEILGRRKEHVNEKLQSVTTKIKELETKSKALLDTGVLSEAQVNEEGLPIMEIREEWPEEEENITENVEKKENEWPTGQLPPSVQRARDLNKKADEKKQEDENKALFDMLRELEEEEEDEDNLEELKSEQKKPWLKQLNQASDQEESDDDDDDDRYDMELAEDIFDKFEEENEEFPLDGIVDQDDFTSYDQDDSYEKSTPSAKTKPKSKLVELNEEPKVQAPLQQTVAETVAEAVVPVADEKTPKKKMSKFKLLKQQERKKTSVDEFKADKPIKNTFKQMQQQKESLLKEPVKEEIEEQEPVKKMSKFKLMKQKERNKDVQSREESANVKFDKEKSSEKVIIKEEMVKEDTTNKETEKKTSRKVTWDTNTTVIEHENHDAPSVLSETESYSQPMKNESSHENIPVDKIRTAHDIARVIHQTAQVVDDYPTLDDEFSPQEVDLNELIKIAKDKIQEPFYRPTDGAMIPMPKQVNSQEGGIIIAKKSKLDNSIMKGSVMERETKDIDLEELEEDMEFREITTKYQEKRQQMLATTGSLSFEPKPEFEVFDEDLPLPSKIEEIEEEEEVVPKKMSRFKAARLGIKDY